ncbi:MAG TPA: hypothetical protein VFA81_04125, partial [Burkholderiales bacterium]|nr:hypothetical protein [Burkholderiales bacterium]
WIFAEMFLKRLFKGMLRALCKHQPRKRMMRLRGKWVEVDPRAWDSDMDVLVNVGLGSGMTEQRIATLTAVAADQTQIIQTLGPTNPICTLAMLRNTKAKLLELRGFKDVSQFYSPVDPNWKPAPAPPPPPTHEQVLAQAETQNELVRTQRELAIKEAELELKRQQAASDRDLKIRQMADDFTLRRLQIEAQFKTSFSEQQLEAAATAQENWLSRVRAGHEMALAQNQQAHDQDIDAHNQALAADQQGHDQDMDQQAQALAAQQAPEQPSGGTQ